MAFKFGTYTFLFAVPRFGRDVGIPPKVKSRGARNEGKRSCLGMGEGIVKGSCLILTPAGKAGLPSPGSCLTRVAVRLPDDILAEAGMIYGRGDG